MLLLLSHFVKEYKCRLNYPVYSTAGVAGVEESSTRWDLMFTSPRSFYSCFRSHFSALASSEMHWGRLRDLARAYFTALSGAHWRNKQRCGKHTPLLHRDFSQTKRWASQRSSNSMLRTTGTNVTWLPSRCLLLESCVGKKSWKIFQFKAKSQEAEELTLLLLQDGEEHLWGRTYGPGHRLHGLHSAPDPHFCHPQTAGPQNNHRGKNGDVKNYTDNLIIHAALQMKPQVRLFLLHRWRTFSSSSSS